MPAERTQELSERDRSQVQSVARAVALLDVLAETGAPQSAAFLAQRCGLDRTVVHRLLRTLTDLGLVEKAQARYALGSSLLRYASAYLDVGRLRRVALPYATELQNRVGAGKPWGISLAVPAGREVVVIDRLWTPAMPLDAVLDIGTRLPVERSAMGRAVLAYLPEEKLDELLDSAATPELRRRLDEIRGHHGIEFASNELRPGISAVAVVIRVQRTGEPAGALAVVGPELEAELHADSRVAAALSRTAARIEATL